MNHKINILHTESSLGWGGQEIRIVNESAGMLERGHKLYLATPEKSTIYKKAGEKGIDVFPASFNKKNPLNFMKIASLIRDKKINIVNTHSSSDSWVATVAAKISGVNPVIIRTRHLSTPISKGPLSRLIYNTLPDAVITTGEDIREKMAAYNKFNKEKIFSIPTGVNLDKFDPLKVSVVIKPKGFSVGMVSVLRSWKGHKYFIRAIPSVLEAIPDSFFYIVGDGPQFQNIKDMIFEHSLENKVVMLGHRDDIPEILASFDVIVHPSYANEGVPQSLLQAMAMEKAVIASDTGAIKEIVFNRETGFLIEPRNPDQISEKIIELYRDPELRKKMGETGRKFVARRCSTENMLDKLESLYKKLLKVD